MSVDWKKSMRYDKKSKNTPKKSAELNISDLRHHDTLMQLTMMIVCKGNSSDGEEEKENN